MDTTNKSYQSIHNFMRIVLVSDIFLKRAIVYLLHFTGTDNNRQQIAIYYTRRKSERSDWFFLGIGKCHLTEVNCFTMSARMNTACIWLSHLKNYNFPFPGCCTVPLLWGYWNTGKSNSLKQINELNLTLYSFLRK